MNGKRSLTILSLIVLLSTIFSGSTPPMSLASQSSPETPANGRTGAWVDTINVSSIDSADEAVDQLEAGTLDMYAGFSGDPVLYDRVRLNQDLVFHVSTGSFNELMMNPAGPEFYDGRLNPFSVHEIREATNWLMDRGAIVQQIMGGMGISKYFCINPGQRDYARYHETVQALEAYYAYDYDRASSVIAAEMASLGATLVDGAWHYDGEPVTLILLIRNEDHRLQIGDYAAGQLESLGFAVERLYKTSAEALPIWAFGDPWEGLWHLYTGGWVSDAVERDASSSFAYFYTPSGESGSPTWQAFTPTPEFEAVANQLAAMDFATMDARDLLFTEALERSMLDSEHVWLINVKSFLPRRADTTAAYDLAGGLWGSDLWPYTVRFLDQEGGVVEVARPASLNQPWNPLAGTSWIWDGFPRRATQDGGVVRDPNTGLMWPQRIEGAEVTIQTGLPVTLTLDWVTLETLPTIEVPSDAWVDWDATNQEWITAGEKFAEPQFAKMKSMVTYPADLFDTINWHDGSPLSVADFVMRMILPFDVANPDSAIYDESQVEDFGAFMSTFKGYHITSTDPLVIEVYSDDWELDAELNVQTLWPNYGRGEGAWHNMAVAYRADESQVLAFTANKADYLGIEWMDFVGEPSLTPLQGYLDQAQAMNFIPYANTLSTYVTPVEATARYTALQAWVAARGHFWLGTGPFYLDSLSHVDGTLTLQRFPAFPDPAGKWDHFSHDPSPPALELNYNAGAPGSSFNVVGTHFPINSLATVSVNREGLGTVFTGASGAFTVTLTTDVGTDEGYYITTVSVNPSASTMFMLDALEPLHEKEGDHESYDVPDGIAIYGFVYLPLVMR